MRKHRDMNRRAMNAAMLLAAALLSGLLTAQVAGAQEPAVAREHQLKAAFLFNFVKFIEWPAGTLDNTITVCFAAGAGVHDAFAAGVKNKGAGDKTIQVRRLEPRAGAAGCDVLYLSADLVKRTEEQAFIASGPRHLLTVSDRKGFASDMGVIEIFTESNKLRFIVNVHIAQQAGLQVSSSLLALAARVERGERK